MQDIALLMANLAGLMTLKTSVYINLSIVFSMHFLGLYTHKNKIINILRNYSYIRPVIINKWFVDLENKKSG